MKNTTVYALDFDGVICDSAVETAITGWKAACTIWDDMPQTVSPEKITQFRDIRPIIETGYEAILAMRLLYLDVSIADIYGDYVNKMQTLSAAAQVSIDDLKRLFGETRDNWIAMDVSDWVKMNPLFDGVAEKLSRLGQTCDWYIVTTKQERFVQRILEANSIILPDERIFGLDRNMSKVEVLRWLSQTHPNTTIYFVEDRLPTLMNVLNSEGLSMVKPLFALWGYNTAEDKVLSAKQPILSLQLEDFLGVI